MGLIKGAGLLAGIAGAGVYLFAQRRSAATGRDIGDILGNLPEELKEFGDEMKQRLRESAGIVREEAARKEAEIDALMEAEEERLEAATAMRPDKPGSQMFIPPS